MNDFLNYWDEVLAYWIEHRAMHPSESHWDFDGNEFFKELMPEPYIGDPTNCSLVIINYNPSAAQYKSAEGQKAYENDTLHHSQLSNPKKMCYHYARNYRERVAAGGYLGRDVDPMYDKSGLTQGGKCWWCKRLNWIKELTDSPKLPFALELCGWHSHKWPGIKNDKKLLSKLRELLAPIIEESVKASDLGVGICIGAQWSSLILPYFGYSDVTGEIMELQNYRRGWKPLGDNDKRNYCILRNDKGVYIINTWLSKSYSPMDVPDSKYREIEKAILANISKHRII